MTTKQDVIDAINECMFTKSTKSNIGDTMYNEDIINAIYVFEEYCKNMQSKEKLFNDGMS